MSGKDKPRKNSHRESGRKKAQKSGSGISQYIMGAVIVAVLVLGIFTMGKKMFGGGSQTSGSDALVTEADAKQTTEQKADNSVPLTKLEITVPDSNVRVGEQIPLDIKTEPANATNTSLTWTINDDSLADRFTLSDSGMLTMLDGAEKHTVTLKAEATDGSGLSASLDLRVYPKIDPSKPMVAITFDDGPNPETTNVMLDAIEENYAKCTFFVLGQNAEYYPEVVKREYDLGQQVGTHGYSHQQLTKLQGAALTQEIEKGVKSVEAAIGTAPVLLRPPYGAYNDTVRAEAKKYGLCCMNWSLDTEDWKTKNADATYQMVMKAVDGDVVLLHDIHQYNVDAVKRFIPDLMEQGYQLVTVSELYAARGEPLDPGTIHFRTDPTEAKEETGPAADAEGAAVDGSGTAGSDAAAGDKAIRTGSDAAVGDRSGEADGGAQ